MKEIRGPICGDLRQKRLQQKTKEKQTNLRRNPRKKIREWYQENKATANAKRFERYKTTMLTGLPRRSESWNARHVKKIFSKCGGGCRIGSIKQKIVCDH